MQRLVRINLSQGPFRKHHLMSSMTQAAGSDHRPSSYHESLISEDSIVRTQPPQLASSLLYGSGDEAGTTTPAVQPGEKATATTHLTLSLIHI